MSKTRLLFAVSAAVTAGTVAVSATASAEWMVNKKNFGAGSKMALMTKGKVTQSVLLVFETAGQKTRIVCSGMEIEGLSPEIRGTNGGFASSLVFFECAVTEGNPTCLLATKTLGTNPVLITEITLDGTLAVKGNFVPETKGIFATIKFEGQECAFLGIQAVTGKARLLAKEGQDERTWQPVLLYSEEGDLKLGAISPKIHGGSELATSTLEPWSYL